MASLLDHLGVGGAILWGLSVGGMIAQRVFDKRPDLVGALVLSNTGHRMGTPEMWTARIEAVRTTGLPGMLDSIMERWFTPAFRSADNPLYSASRNMLARQSPEGYCGTCDALRHADLTDVARKISVPTLCVAGDQDGAAPPALVRSLSDLVPSSTFIEIASCGHIPCVEQPAAYSAGVAAFLNTLPRL
jgi:3-oxoadipate enol-lactonase